MAHLRAVDYRVCLLNITQFSKGEGITEDVLGDIFDALGVTSPKPNLVMDAEPGVMPPSCYGTRDRTNAPGS